MPEVSANIEGLDEAMKALVAAFPQNERRQRGILNASMRAASRGMVQEAKRLAKQGDASGALSEAIVVRAISKRRLRAAGRVAGVEIVPVRHNKKALSMYIQHYYTSRGRTASAKMAVSGIRHGHLVEFGSINNPARPFMYPAAQAGQATYVRNFAADLRKKIEAAVRREARKR